MSRFAAMELAVDQPSRMTIHHPVTGLPLNNGAEEAWVELYSLDSTKAATYERSLTDRRLQQRNKQALTAEQMEAEHVSRLANLTAGWFLMDFTGTPLEVPFSAPAAQELYSSNAMKWLREQVEVFLANRSNFTKSLSKS
jgi:hypothetical protein